MTLGWDRVKLMAAWTALVALFIKYRAAAIGLAILALLLVAFAYDQGWISPPTWYTSKVAPAPVVDAPKRATPAQIAQAAASVASDRKAAEKAANSAEFAAEGSARNATSAASSARASATSAAAAKVSEGKSEAAANRAEKAATRAEAAAKAPRPAVVPKVPAAPPEKRAEKPDTKIAGAGPESYSSLQPFQRFARGAGEGMAYEYRPRSKAEFVALLRDKNLAKREMRVPCEVLVRQMAEGHKALPLEGCEGTAALIERDSRFTVVACSDDMFLRNNFLTVTNESGSGFGVWHRKCLPNEHVLSYEGSPLISLLCLNVAVPVAVPEPVRLAPPPVAAAPPLATSGPLPTTPGCPAGIALYANAWTMESMPEDLRRRAEALIAAAARRDSQNASNAEAYKPDALSRTIGDELIATVSVRAPVGTDIRAQLLDPESLRVVRDLGTFRFNSGIAKIPLAPDDRKLIVQTIWPAWFSSPTVSGGERRLWLFPNEWANKTGGRYCTKQVNGAYLQANKPGP